MITGLKPRFFAWLTVFCLLGLLLFSLRSFFSPPGPGAAKPADRLQVIASIYPLADFVRRIGGDRVEVTTLLPPGASPHSFEPVPAQARLMARADLFVLVGAGLDPWADQVFEAGGRPGATARLALADGIDLLGNDCPEEDGHHHPGRGNPHIWLDPVLVAETVAGPVRDKLSGLDPAGAGYYQERAASFKAELAALDQEIRRETAGFSIRRYVAFHPAWVYFARRYGLEEAGVIRRFPDQEPAPREIRAVMLEIKRYGIRAIFAEAQFPPAMAQAVARETGAKVLILDPLGGEGLPGRDNYLALMRYNLAIMSEGMK